MNRVMQAPVAQAKSQLADLLRRAEFEEKVVITRRGLPVDWFVATQRPGPPPVSANALDPKLYQDMDLDEPRFTS